MIRITAGYLKNQVINTPARSLVRPSSAKLRESVFNIIQQKVNGSEWLDLFSGTGSIGIEAISRNAGKVIFVEKDYSTFRVLSNNIKNLKIEHKASIFRKDSLLFLNKCEDSFDYIFIDPPYKMVNYYNESLAIIENSLSLLKPDGNLIFEHSSEYSPTGSERLILYKSYNYGSSYLTFYRKLL